MYSHSFQNFQFVILESAISSSFNFRFEFLVLQTNDVTFQLQLPSSNFTVSLSDEHHRHFVFDTARCQLIHRCGIEQLRFRKNSKSANGRTNDMNTLHMNVCGSIPFSLLE